jgi:hypothetical protein
VIVRRVAAVVAVAAIVPLVASALSGCDTKVGTAGVVSGDRISEATVSNYVTPQAQSVQLNNGQTLAARSFVLQTLVNTRVAEQVLAAHGMTPTDEKIAAAQQLALGDTSEDDLVKALTTHGFDPSFAPVYLRAIALSQLLTEVPGITNQQGLQDAMSKANVSVDVNPRYGTWNSKELALDSDLASNLPPYLKVSGSATPTPTPTG